METQQPITEFIRQSDEFHQHIGSIYKLLDPTRLQIRLMHICPGSFDDEQIDVTLSVVDLDDNPQYEALSYTWDSLQATKTINLCGVPYQVTTNQYSALRRLRSPDGLRIIWMDVICINQTDIPERGRQVSIMNQIYAGATQTRIWLGEPESDWFAIDDHDWDNHVVALNSNSARVAYMKQCAGSRSVGIMRDFVTVVEKQTEGLLKGALHLLGLLTDQVHFRDMPYCFVDERGDLAHYRPFYHVLEMVLSLLRRPWWMRVWVLQEACLSKITPVVHVGGQQASIHVFTDARQGWNQCIANWKHDDHFLDHVYDISAWIDGMSRLMTYGNALETLSHKFGRLSLSVGLELVSKREAGDMRDFVYGIMGVISEDDRLPIDYSLSMGETFSLATWHVYADRVDGFEMLKEAAGLDADNMPSWSVNWARRNDLHFVDSDVFQVREETDRDRTQCHLLMGVLQVTANKIDQVIAVLRSGEDPDVRVSDQAREMIFTWARQLWSLRMLPDTNLDASDDASSVAYFLTTIFRETIKNEQGRMVRFASTDDDGFEWRDILTWIEQLRHTSELESESMDKGLQLQGPSHPLASTFESSVMTSALCVTQQGRLCMALDSVQAGDFVYHVRGCSTPLALRPARTRKLRWVEGGSDSDSDSDDDDDDDYDEGGSIMERPIDPFTVVGPCYIRGAMGVDGADRAKEEVIYLV